MTTAEMTFYRTAVGKKVVMAITGFITFGFVAVHVLGNLQIFLGPERLNKYAAFLQGLGGLLWVFRGVLVICVVLHIWSATLVTLQSWAARPKGYAVKRFRETTYAARTMRWGGPIIGLFVIYHLLHFTTGQLHPSPDTFHATADGLMNVYNNVILGFQVPWTAAVYMVAMVFVGLHLYHGVWSMLQTIGASQAKWNPWRRRFAVLFALFVTLGGLSIPVAVLAGLVVPVV
ncbi:MAG: succinate dehydrogenase cytochrome b subunit [Proteobacteria bacterium]|jgi:succinate dehydrogenase / fumarate reductase cytochrome b subunit|nr:succinate dehydrogenase cytochrome b subunit [Pseudomonadota bacterium]